MPGRVQDRDTIDRITGVEFGDTGHMAAGNTWVLAGEHDAATTGSSYLERLAAAGVLDEVEAVWDAEDQGIDVCAGARPVDDVIAELRARRNG